jgi:hypothetical protein
MTLTTTYSTKWSGKFNLIFCSRVWDHIWHHRNAFENIENLTSSGSYLWLASPASHRATHSLPIWLSVKSLRQPLLHRFSGSNILARYILTFKHSLRNAELYFVSQRGSADISFTTES